MTPESIRTIYDYNYWAFDQMWTCVNQLTNEQFTQDLGYSSGSIRNQLVHVISATPRWLARIKGAPVPAQPVYEEYTSPVITRQKWDEVKAETLAYIYALDQAQLDRIVHWEIPTRKMSEDNRQWELLLHLANHGADHRVQILATLELHYKIKTFEQDLLFYLLEVAKNRKG